MGLVGGAPVLLVLIAPHLCRRQQSMPPLQRADPVPAVANSASRHASRRGLASEGGSRTPRSEFRRACVFPKNQADGEAILLRKAELHIGLGGGTASDRSTPTPLRRNHRAMNRNRSAS